MIHDPSYRDPNYLPGGEEAPPEPTVNVEEVVESLQVRLLHRKNSLRSRTFQGLESPVEMAQIALLEDILSWMHE